jgi:hypothetical protein
MASFARGDHWQSMRPNMHFTFAAWILAQRQPHLVNAVIAEVESSGKADRELIGPQFGIGPTVTVGLY